MNKYQKRLHKEIKEAVKINKDEKSFDTNEEWSKSFQNHCEHWKPIEIEEQEEDC